jgi:hypothetical protein
VVVVFQNLVLEFQRREIADGANGGIHLANGERNGFALFFGQQAGEVFLLGFQGIGQLDQSLLAFTPGLGAPSRESCFGGGDGCVQLGLVGDRALGEYFFGGRIDHVNSALAVYQFAIDQQFKISHFRPLIKFRKPLQMFRTLCVSGR